ncbi:dUTP diphosphatase [Methylobacterium sp. AMS5]|uniref:dUTP diphosphatase n=1 Tax=Methylobacterium sp. AMS5 TaxID=925818 RepID=UPI00074F8607|nr:deoxyuridine 5'-triphosphate nucleotidohydrolase [Methylobacterium sp. AMS5]
MNAVAPFRLQVKRLTETAILPVYGSDFAAGMDLHADIPHASVVAPGEHKLFPTGIAIALPASLALLVCPRSGLSAKSGITVHNGPGVIDADYRGGIGVVIHNTTHQQFVVKPGDRIAQGVIVPVYRAIFDEVEELDETERGTGGFGSTGVGGFASGGILRAADGASRGLVGDVIREQMRPGGMLARRCDNRAAEFVALPGGLGTKWLEAEPEEAAAAIVKGNAA